VSKLGDVTANGADCFRGELVLPHQGAWVIDLTMDAGSAPTGRVSVNFAGRTLSGTVVHDPADASLVLSGDSGGIKHVRIVAGVGGLYQALNPKSYDNGSTVSTILGDLLSAGGEVPAADIDPALLSRLLPQWAWTGGTLMGALQQLAQAVGCVFRARDDGSIWLGVPSPQRVTPPDLVGIDIAPEAGQASYGLDDPSLDVDQIVDGLTLRQVVYLWEPGEMRALVTYAPGPAASLFQLVGVWLRRFGVEFLRPQPGRIDRLNAADGTAQVQPDDVANYPPLRRVAQRYGLPDTTCQGVSGRCAVGWEAGSPQSPAILNYGNSTATKIKIGASAGTEPTIKGTTYRQAEALLTLKLRILFATCAAQLTTAAGEAMAPSLAAAALALDNPAPGGGVVQALKEFEDTATANNNFLTKIVEAG
jgi:hypothetical protein